MEPLSAPCESPVFNSKLPELSGDAAVDIDTAPEDKRPLPPLFNASEPPTPALLAPADKEITPAAS